MCKHTSLRDCHGDSRRHFSFEGPRNAKGSVHYIRHVYTYIFRSRGVNIMDRVATGTNVSATRSAWDVTIGWFGDGIDIEGGVQGAY